MAILQQLRLLLYRNFILRIRQPVILSFELLWPIVMFLAVLATRKAVPPIDKETCYYNAWSLPSTGALPFLQSLICNVDNDCLNKSSYEEIPSYPNSRIHQLVEHVQPLMFDENITSFIEAMPKGMNLVRAAVDVIGQPDIKELIDRGVLVKDLLKEPAQTKQILKEMGLSTRMIENLLDAYVKVPKMLEMLSFSPKFLEAVCDDPQNLRKILVSRDQNSLDDVSKILCGLNSSSADDLVSKLKQQVNIGSIIHLMSQVMSKFGRSDVGQILGDVGNMLGIFTSLSEGPFSMTGSDEFPTVLYDVRSIVEEIENGSGELELISEVITDFEPLFENNGDVSVKSILNYLSLISKWFNKEFSGNSRDAGSNLDSSDIRKSRYYSVQRRTNTNSLQDPIISATNIKPTISNKWSATSIDSNDKKIATPLEASMELLYNIVDVVDTVANFLAVLPVGKDFEPYYRNIVRFANVVVESLMELGKNSKQGKLQEWVYLTESFFYTMANRTKWPMMLNVKSWEPTFCNPEEFFALFVIPIGADKITLQKSACGLATTIWKGLELSSKDESFPKMREIVENLNHLMSEIKNSEGIYDKGNGYVKLQRLQNAYQTFVASIWPEGNSTDRMLLVALDEVIYEIASSYPDIGNETFAHLFMNPSLSFRGPMSRVIGTASLIRYPLWAWSELARVLALLRQKSNNSLTIEDIVKIKGPEGMLKISHELPFALQLLVDWATDPLLTTKMLIILSEMDLQKAKNFTTTEALCHVLYDKQNEQQSECPDVLQPVEILPIRNETQNVADYLKDLICQVPKGTSDLVEKVDDQDDLINAVINIIHAWNNRTVSDLPILTPSNVDQMFNMADDIRQIMEGVATKLEKPSDNNTKDLDWKNAIANSMKRLKEADTRRFSFALQYLAVFVHGLNSRLKWKMTEGMTLATIYVNELRSALKTTTKLSGPASLDDVTKGTRYLQGAVTWAEKYLLDGIEIFLFTLSAEENKLVDILTDEDPLRSLCDQPSSSYLLFPSGIDESRIEDGKKEFCLLIQKHSFDISQCTNMSNTQLSLHVIMKFLQSAGDLLDFFAQNANSLPQISSPLFNSSAWSTLLRKDAQRLNISWHENSTSTLRSVAKQLATLLGGQSSVLHILDEIMVTGACALQRVKGGVNVEKSPNDETASTDSFEGLINKLGHILQITRNAVHHPTKLSSVVDDLLEADDKSAAFCSISAADWQGHFLELPEQSQAMLTNFQKLVCSRSFWSHFLQLNPAFSCLAKLENVTLQGELNSTEFADHVDELYQVVNDVMATVVPPKDYSFIENQLNASDWMISVNDNAKEYMRFTLNHVPALLETFLSIPGIKTSPYLPVFQNTIKAIADNIKKLDVNGSLPSNYISRNFSATPSFGRDALEAFLDFIEIMWWKSLPSEQVQLLFEFTRQELCNSSIADASDSENRLAHQRNNLTMALCNSDSKFSDIHFPSELISTMQMNDSIPMDWENFQPDMPFLLKLLERRLKNQPEANLRNKTDTSNTILTPFNRREMTQNLLTSAFVYVAPIISSWDLFTPRAGICSSGSESNLTYETRILCDIESIQSIRHSLNASREIAKMLLLRKDMKEKEWVTFYKMILELANFNSLLKVIDGGYTENKSRENTVEKDLIEIASILSSNSKNLTSTMMWKKNIRVISAVLHLFGSKFEATETGRSAFHIIRSLITFLLERLTAVQKSDNPIVTVANLFPKSPATQKFVKEVAPRLPDFMSTILWTSLAESKLNRLVTESKRNMTIALSLLCNGTVTDFLYNPSFTTQDWDSLMSVFCSQKYYSILEEIFDDPNIQEIAFEDTDNEDPIEWNDISESLLQLHSVIEKIQKVKKFDPSLLPTDENIWMDVIRNISVQTRNPSVMLYLTMNKIFYKFCRPNAIASLAPLPSDANATELERVFCRMSEEDFTNYSGEIISDLVRRFSKPKNPKGVGHSGDHENDDPPMWLEIYDAVMNITQMKQMLHALVGREIFDRVLILESDTLSAVDKLRQLQGMGSPNYNFSSKEAIRTLYDMIDKLTNGDLTETLSASPISYIAEYMGDLIEGSTNFQEIFSDQNRLKKFLEIILDAESYKNYKNRELSASLTILIEYFQNHPTAVESLCTDPELIEAANTKGSQHHEIISIICKMPLSEWKDFVMGEHGIRIAPALEDLSLLALKLPDDDRMKLEKWKRDVIKERNEDALVLLFNHFVASLSPFSRPEKSPPWSQYFRSILKTLPDVFNSLNHKFCLSSNLPAKESLLNELSIRIMDAIPDAEILLCDLAKRNISSLYHWIATAIDLKGIIHKEEQLKSSNSTDISSCVPVYGTLRGFSDFVDRYVTSVETVNVTVMEHCFHQALQGPLWKSLEKFGNLLGHIASAVSKLMTKKSEVINLEKMVDKYLVPQLPAISRVSEIVIEDFENSSTIFSEYVRDDVLNTLMNSSLNLNWIARRKFSTVALRNAVCSSNEFNEQYVLMLDKEEKQASRKHVHDFLCHQNGIEMLMRAINTTAVISQIPVLQMQEFRSGIWLQQLMSNSSDILSSVIGIGEAAVNLTFDFTSKAIFPSLSQLIDTNIADKLLKNLRRLEKSIEPVFEGSPLMDFLRQMLRGIQGLKALKEMNVFDIKYQLKELFNNIKIVRQVLRSHFSLSEENINLVLNSVLDLSQVLAKSDSESSRESIFCEHYTVVESFRLEDSNLTLHDVTDLFCSLATSDEVFYEATKMRSEISFMKYMRNFAELGIGGILDRAEMTRKEAEEVIEVIKTAPEVLPLLHQHIQSLTAVLEPEVRQQVESLNISSEGIRVLATPVALDAGGKIICGRPLKALQNQFTPLIASKKEPNLDPVEFDQLPNEFCRRGYEQVMRMAGGPIVWGFLKPLFRGKILYSPENTWTRRIVKEMNGTFEIMSRYINVLHAMAQGTTSLHYLEQRKDAMGSIKSILLSDSIRPLIFQILGTEPSELLTGFDVSAFKSNLGNTGSILEVVELVGNISQCFEIERFVGFEKEKELEKAAGRLQKDREFIAAIVFLEEKDEKGLKRSRRHLHPPENPLPQHVHYKIRMDIDNVPTSNVKKDKQWRPDAHDNFFDDLRYFRGFIQLQEYIDSAIMVLQTGNSSFHKTYLQQFPYPCYKEDKFGMFLKSCIPGFMTVSWIFIISFLVRERVLERELYLDEIMHVMGLRPVVGWLAWFISGLVVLFLSVVGIVLILKFGGIMPLSNPFILFLFIMDFAVLLISYTYLISVFFKNATTAALVAIVIYGISFLPYMLILTWDLYIQFWLKMLSCLLVATVFCFGSSYFDRYEDQGYGIQWDNIWSSPVPGDDMNLALSIITMAACSAFYFLLAWYISQVYPVGQRSLKQPWYFFVTSTYWGFRSSSISVTPPEITFIINGREFSDDFKDNQDLQQTEKIGISVKNLKVVYNQGQKKEKLAVRNLTLDILEGQITTLLGQNGAGKTTTINVLTGRYPPTTGMVRVYGKTMPHQLSEARKLIGYCPQHNTLFGKLSVEEHLYFFGKLKGVLTGKELDEDVDEMLHNMDLHHRRHHLTCYLSGGQKRRLCVALAFIGGSKVIILDEPTSSLDPVARRSIWDLIVKYKHRQTILLTTHHLDEADILSDRVAVLHKGELLCHGTPLLLKSKYGSGYQLTLASSLTDADDHENDSGNASTCSSSCSESISKQIIDGTGVMEFIQSFIPTATVLENHSSQLVVSLPYYSTNGSSHNFADFFTELDLNLNKLGFSSYGLSSTTLEEVFLTLCSLEDAKLQHKDSRGQNSHQNLKNQYYEGTRKIFKVGKDNDIKHSPLVPDASFSDDLNLGSERPLRGRKLKLQQLTALLTKRYHHTRQSWKLIASSILLPCLFIALAMALTSAKPGKQPEPVLRISPSIYQPGPISFFSASDSPSTNEINIINALLKPPEAGPFCLESLLKQRNCSSLKSSQLHDLLDDVFNRDHGCLCKTEECLAFDASDVTFFSRSSGDIIYNLTSHDVSQYLLDTYTMFSEKRYGGWTFSTNAENETLVKVWFDNGGYHSAPSYLNSISNAILTARLGNKAKTNNYGITTYNHPLQLSVEQLGRDTFVHRFSEVGIALIFLVGLSLIPSKFVVYVVNERIREEKRLQFIGGVGPVLYWLSAMMWDMLLILITVALSAVIIAAFGLPSYVARHNFSAVILLIFLFGWATTPLMYLLSNFFQEASIAFMVLYSINVFIGLEIMIAVVILSILNLSNDQQQNLQVVKYLGLIFPQYSLIGGLIDLSYNHIQADIYDLFGQDTYEEPFSMNLIGPNYIVMAVEGFIFLIINILFEMRHHKCIQRKFATRPEKRQHVEDSDVEEERRRVTTENWRNDVLKLRNLTQVFKSNVGINYAIDDLNLGIPKGECFGLLGVNGAGKTSLFRILTGQTTATAGNVHIDDMEVSEVLESGNQLLGYCPQADALDGLLTPRQHFLIYSMLRGIPGNEITKIVEQALRIFTLLAHADCQVRALSGGTRRKVCTALAMIGNPQIILLDEPTTGMDPLTRRLVWNNVMYAIKDHKRSVLLTSHSVEECDILCSRIAIMVNGTLRCLGTPQHLKNKFGTGYMITLRVADAMSNWGAVINFIHTYFPSAVLKDLPIPGIYTDRLLSDLCGKQLLVRDHHCNTVEFSLPSKSISLSEIFRNLERGEHLGIKDVSVNQTTLDQVFVDFVRQQSDGIQSMIEKPRHQQERKLDPRTSLSERNLIANEYTEPRNSGLEFGAFIDMSEIEAEDQKDSSSAYYSKETDAQPLPRCLYEDAQGNIVTKL